MPSKPTTTFLPLQHHKSNQDRRQYRNDDSCSYGSSSQKVCVFGSLPGSTSSFKTATSPAHSTKALPHHRKRVFSEDFSSLHQDDFWSHPLGVVVGLSSSFTYTSLFSQQKNRRHSFSQDAANQGSQSPRWAPDLATSRRNFIPSIPKASFSSSHLHPPVLSVQNKVIY